MEGRKSVIYVLAALAVWAAFRVAAGEPPRSPYHSITERNVFGLKPLPAQPIVAPSNSVPPPPKVLLTGITTILGPAMALLKVQMPAKPGQPPGEQSYILTEGQKEGNIEVLKIDDAAGTVQLSEYGTIMTLDINRDSPKLPSTPQAPPLAQAIVLPAPGNNPVPTNPAALPATAPAVTPPALPEAATNGLRAMPTRVPRTGAMSQPPPLPPPPDPQTQQAQQAQQLTPEEQALLQELERQTTNQVRP